MTWNIDQERREHENFCEAHRQDQRRYDRAKYRASRAFVWALRDREEEKRADRRRRLATAIRLMGLKLGRHLSEEELAAIPDEPSEHLESMEQD